jgi:hypothetical protein
MRERIGEKSGLEKNERGTNSEISHSGKFPELDWSIQA